LEEVTQDRRNLLICALVTAVVVFASLPFVEAGFNDDWSYAHVALNLARTGHLEYDNWGAPTLFVQAAWGAVLIRLFGFSFELLRFSTLPFAMGCGILCYLLAKRSRLPGGAALFASLAFVTSPLFVPLAASFMTDVYGCFFTLLTIYCGVRAAEGPDRPRTRLKWLAVAALAGAIGGMERQTVYLAPAAVLLWAIWNRRQERSIRVGSAAILMLVMCAGASVVLWQMRQPFGAGTAPAASSWHKAVNFPVQLILTLTLLTIPAAIPLCLDPGMQRVRRCGLYCLIVLATFALYATFSGPRIFPWMFNLIGKHGILGAEDIGGEKPVVFSQSARIALTAVVLAVLLLIVARVAGAGLRLFRAWPATLQIFAIFAVLYSGLLTYQARAYSYDRYALPLIPLALIALLLAGREKRNGVAAGLGWATLVIFAIYGVASTHDYYASLRSRMAAVELLQRSGIPRLQINGGLELDCWLEDEVSGHVTHPVPAVEPTSDSVLDGTWLLSYTPRIDGRYRVSWSDLPGYRRSPLGPVPMLAWLPPFRRQILILARKDAR
jgi:hypothetical protein